MGTDRGNMEEMDELRMDAIKGDLDRRKASLDR